ncbi:peptidoglycan glycosyltransferase [Ruficoccus amylovorans]|uniref:Peptidoglycan glycosyltransferase n=1 Tax=Ruficoccus amylovorans TaxID=1804625 RepID=A0A842HCE0_9BACT|nr:penicillin-binding transpeptidase domain-containing protein [Ruficoccus amylovorans]MBC2594082.1 peptidoglycan glycosyltransferase [Ruficoccus amylovorans]
MKFDHFKLWNSRLNIFFLVFGLMFMVLAGGLAWRQLILQGEWKAKEERQNMRRVIQPGPRGDILDRHGNILVGNRPRFSAVVYLRELREEFDKEYSKLINTLREKHREENPDTPFSFDWQELRWESRRIVLQRYLDQINAILGTDDTVTLRDLQRHYWSKLLMPFPLMGDLEPEEYARLIEQLPLGSPIDIYTDTARDYPFGPTACHTLGYVVANPEGIKEDAIPGEDLKTFHYKSEVGKNGLEKAFDDQLQGTSGGEIWVVDRFQFQYDKPLVEIPAKQGANVITSLDIDLQLAAEEAMSDKTGAAVAIDIKTGEVLVLASKPGYNLNDFSPFIRQEAWNQAVEQGALYNRATQGLYAPGSTFKMITAIAALRNGMVGANEYLECGTHFRVGNRLFPEHSHASFGQVDLRKALQKSSNVYFYQVGLRAGIENIAAEAKRLGLGEPTGIEIPYEATRMIVPTPAWRKERDGRPWTQGDTANVSIGQGDLFVTPLQMAAFAASLARRETHTRVTLLHDPEQKPVNHGGEPLGLDDAQYRAIVEGMEAAAGPEGTARFAMVDGVQIAGKTGTAQVKRPSGKITLAWFLGFAPAENPQIAVAVVMEGLVPGDHYAGGKTAAPVARAIFETYFADKDLSDLLAQGD